MENTIQKILDIWHNRFNDESIQYSEFENSDIEYFVGCLLYNHFTFEKALDTMKTIDLSYDFLESCGENEYDEVMSLVKSINIEDENEKISLLQSFLDKAMEKYNEDEIYLLRRLAYHVDGIKQRQEKNENVQKVEFVSPLQKSPNPLLR